MPSEAVCGRSQQQSIIRTRAGPTAIAAADIIYNNPLSSFCFFSTSLCRETSKNVLLLKLTEFQVILIGRFLWMSWRSLLVLSLPEELSVVNIAQPEFVG